MIVVLLAALTPAQSAAPPAVALIHGQWFNGQGFESRTMYSSGGFFTSKKPLHVDRTIDLVGAWIVPPFAEAHNHNLGTGVDAGERKAIRKYLTDGVFYVKIQGNLPVSAEWKEQHDIDVIFAQGSLTATGGHPIGLVEMLLRQGYYPGNSRESLHDNRYFTIDSEADLDRKWPRILAQGADFIKVFLWASDEFEKRKNGHAEFGQKGLDPRLVPLIVQRAHAIGLRVSAHVTDNADFHNALEAGVDEITHIPFSIESIGMEDVELAANRKITVITTCSMVRTLPRAIIPAETLPAVLRAQAANVKLLFEHRVRLAVGSDNPADSSLLEVEYLKNTGPFDNLSLLRLWAETTPQAIFPGRLIGHLKDGFEASFLALDGNPLDDFQNVRKVRLRFRKGREFAP